MFAAIPASVGTGLFLITLTSSSGMANTSMWHVTETFLLCPCHTLLIMVLFLVNSASTFFSTKSSSEP